MKMLFFSKKPYTAKLTTKYKLPNLCTEMNKAIESNAEIIKTGKIQNYGHSQLKIDNDSGLLEISKLCKNKNIHRLPSLKNKNIHRLPSLKNKAKYKRGAGDHLKYL